ncbi:MAG: HNH endonuclease, partial [Flavobacteriales bacterium]|nr:HNH endonuclease [Flavobacteriales bacterium]
MLRPLTGRFEDVSVCEAPEVVFISKQLEWPITEDEGANRAHALAELFPIYDAWLRAAQGLDDRMPLLLGKLEEYLARPHEEDEEVRYDSQEQVTLDIASLAIERTIALPAKRYQVFQRDGWKCVSCGKNPVEHEIILHVDHIVPRSKGGTDTLENYQTLCDLCNLGKSNRDDTNIRAQHHK